MLTYDDALQQVMNSITTLPPIEVPFDDAPSHVLILPSPVCRRKLRAGDIALLASADVEYVTISQCQGSGSNRCLSAANALLSVPVGIEMLSESDDEEVLLL